MDSGNIGSLCPNLFPFRTRTVTGTGTVLRIPLFWIENRTRPPQNGLAAVTSLVLYVQTGGSKWNPSNDFIDPNVEKQRNLTALLTFQNKSKWISFSISSVMFLLLWMLVYMHQSLLSRNSRSRSAASALSSAIAVRFWAFWSCAWFCCCYNGYFGQSACACNRCACFARFDCFDLFLSQLCTLTGLVWRSAMISYR